MHSFIKKKKIVIILMEKDKTGKLKWEVKEKCAIRVLGCTTVLQIVEKFFRQSKRILKKKWKNKKNWKTLSEKLRENS